MSPKISALLKQIQSRVWIIDGGAATCLAVVGALITIVLGMWFDLVWELPSGVRAATWGCAAVALVAALSGLLLRTWRGSQIQSMAKRVDEAASLGGQLTNGWELSGQLAVASPQLSSPLTSGLAAIVVQRAEQLVDTVSPGQVISNRSLVRASRWLAAVVAGIVVAAAIWPAMARTQWQRFISPWSDTPPYSPFQFVVEPGDTEVLYGKGLDVRVTVTGPLVHDLYIVAQSDGQDDKLLMFPESNGTWRASLSRLTADTTYLIRTDRARSRAYRVRVITTPVIEEVRFRVVPPAYTNSSAYEGPLPKDGLAGLVGTRVEVTARSNRPLSRGEVRLAAGKDVERVPLRTSPTSESTVKGEFQISRSTKFEVEVTDTADQPCQEPFSGSITLLTDERPLVRLLEPKPMSLATPTSMLPVVLDAEDDYGLSRVELYRSLNESRPLPLELPVASPPPRRIREQHYLPLNDYGLQPGDEIKLFARVTDNDPAGAKGTESTVVTVRIISQADFERMVRVREGLQVLVSKYQQAERRLERLAQEIESLEKELEKAPADSPLADQLRAQLQQMAQELRQESEAIAKAAAHELPYDIDKNLKKRLDELAKELADAAKELENFAEGSPQPNMEAVRRQLAKMKKQLGERKQNFLEEITDPLDVLTKVYPLLEDQARFTALVMWQKDIAERLSTYRSLEQGQDPAVKARLRDLQDEQRRAREELAQLLEDIENHATAVPDGEEYDELRKTATEFVAAVRSSGAAETMGDAETSLGRFEGAAGHRHAREAGIILEQFLKKCDAMGGEGRQCLAFNPSLSNNLGDSIEQLLADAGLSSGPNGMGQGGQGGYSARTGGNRVGLYGGMEALAGMARSGNGFGNAASLDPNVPPGGSAALDATSMNAIWSRSASGAGASQIPPQYRRRVNRYFQRVAEELEQTEQ